MATLPLLILSTLPIFFDELRVILANAVARDLYEVLNFNLFAPDINTVSPFAYRVIPMAIIELVNSFNMPATFSFVLSEQLSQEVYNKRFSIAIVSYAFQISYSALVYLSLRYSNNLSQIQSAFGFYISYASIHFCAIYTVDSVTVFVLFLVFCAIQRRNFLLFSVLAILSIFINEKISLITCVYLILAYGLGPALRSRYFYIILIALIGYFAFRKIFPVPGHEHQLQPYLYIPTLWSNLFDIWFTFRGVITVLLPLFFTFSLFAISAKSRRLPLQICLMPFALLFIGGALNLSYSNGRFVAHAIPFVIVPFVLSFINEKTVDTLRDAE